MSECGDFYRRSTDENLKDPILKALNCFRNEILELYLPKEVPILNEIPEPFTFHRNWVAPNVPVLIKGGVREWPALNKWNREYICEKLRNKKISVAVTPNGYADSITKTILNGKNVELFVLPEEKTMFMDDFFNKLDAHSSTDQSNENSEGIFYIQKQNSNLTEEFPELLPDIDQHLQWASETFQSKPAAINLWIGDERAVTSLHKDPFENIYCVISGHKEFTLFPPTDRPWLPYKKLPVGQYKEVNPGKFKIEICSNNWKTQDFDIHEENKCSCADYVIEENKVPWIAVDPSCPDIEKFPLYKYSTPLKVKVEKGDMLYLPSMWFHYVTQSHKCIAINYWYDMNFDLKYAYFQLLENLTKYIEKFSLE